jgi:hypothetical protein
MQFQQETLPLQQDYGIAKHQTLCRIPAARLSGL